MNEKEQKFDSEGFAIEKPDLSMFDDLPDFDIPKNLYDVELDTQGLNCPLPIIKLKKEMKQMSIGQRIKLISTDPTAVDDVTTFCNHTKQCLEKTIKTEDGKFIFLVSKIIDF